MTTVFSMRAEGQHRGPTTDKGGPGDQLDFAASLSKKSRFPFTLILLLPQQNSPGLSENEMHGLGQGPERHPNLLLPSIVPVSCLFSSLCFQCLSLGKLECIKESHEQDWH